MHVKHFSLLGAVALLAACQPVDRISPVTGESVRQNMAAQIIDPTPYEERGLSDGDEASSGPRAGDALKRYQEGNVRRPVTPNTSRVTGTVPGGGGAAK